MTGEPRWRRLLRLMLLDGFRAAPGWMSAVTALLVLGSVAATCYPLGYRVMVDGALEHDPGRVVGGAAIIGGLLAVGWVLTGVGGIDAMALTDRLSIFRTAGLMRLISGIPGLAHLERPEYLTEVERVNTNRRLLAGAPRQFVGNLSSVARIVALVLLLASVSWWLALLPLLAVFPLVADRMAKRITRRAEDAAGHTRRLADMLFGLAATAGTASELRIYGLGGHIAERHRALVAELDRRSAREALAVLAVQGFGWLLYAAGLMAAIAFVVVRAADGLMSVGSVLMAVSLIRRSRTQLAVAAQRSGAMINTLTTADRLFWLEDHAAEEVAHHGREPAPAVLRDGIRLRGVSFAYPGTDALALDGVDMLLPAGSTVALVGENGAGKTTLVKLLLGMYLPDRGTIEVDGRSLGDIDPQAWRARCTAAFQDYARLYVPAVAAVGVGDLPRVDDEQAVTTAMDRAGGADLVAKLPDGLRTLLGTAYVGGHGLSGGQWQKVALGRAFMRADPLVVVLDEPTASLDATAEHALFRRYAEAARRGAARSGAVTLLISHRFSTVRTADLVVVMDGGRVLEAGSHEELLAAGGRYAELFNLQAVGYQ